MGSFWTNLSERERLLIAVAGALAAALLFVLLVFRPLNDWRATQASTAKRAENGYDLVSQAVAVAGGRENGSTARNQSVPIRNAQSRAAAQTGVKLNSYNVRPDGTVEANAAATEPAALFSWIGALAADYGVRVDYADIAREQLDPTLVRAQLTFSRPAGPTGGGV